MGLRPLPCLWAAAAFWWREAGGLHLAERPGDLLEEGGAAPPAHDDLDPGFAALRAEWARNPGHGRRCADDPDFVDARGVTCRVWGIMGCDRHFGRGTAELRAVQHNCSLSCGLCSPVAPTAPAVTVGRVDKEDVGELLMGANYDKIMYVLLTLVALILFLAAARYTPLGNSKDQYEFDEDEMNRVFRAIDKDMSGTISLEEVTEFVKSHGLSIPDNQISALVAIADTDGSGDIDREEFVVLLGALHGEDPQELARSLLAEAIGMFIFQFLGGMPTSGAMGNSLIEIGITYAFAPISGAHFNPAVTCAVVVARQIPVKKAVWYIVVALLAAIEACFCLQLCGVHQITNAAGRVIDPCNHAMPSHPRLDFFLLEVVCAFTYVLVFIGVAVDPKGAWGNVAPLVIGITNCGIGLTCGTGSGASVNPARFLAPCVVYGCIPSPSEWLVYMGGSVVASIFAAWVYMRMFMHRPTPELTTGMANFQFMVTDFSRVRKQLAQMTPRDHAAGQRGHARRYAEPSPSPSPRALGTRLGEAVR